MFKSSFYKMFRVEVMHTYFVNNICKGLVYVASKETKGIIKRFSLKLKVIDNGFEFYTQTEKTIEEFLNYITLTTGEESFNFNITTTNQQFYHYTNLPVNQLGVIKFSSASVETSNKEKKLIPSFTKKQEANILSRVSIHFQELVKLDKSKELANYKIQFKARETQWKYFILNNSKQNLGELSITGKSEKQFKGPFDVILQNGQKAQEFSLKEGVLPLSEVPKYQFNLISNTKKNGEARTRVICKGLPTPNPNTIEIKRSESELVVASLMYVYV
ncbi:hypothetical protein V1T75_08870 [Tenacibaculum sp. FZY0031]|uniref:hypothetical protein n=1 Tax=Tenacibaculum sp. FZY0031 TaxID=3116648 RepID=UPI002EA0DBBB|nr:hypothetical protein [Tenacibaculum sp. FZY0031]